jgi:uncharacterized protein
MIVNCPACGHILSTHETGGITVDVCRGGCGGIWFDAFELQRVDEAHEAVDERLFDVPCDPDIKVDSKARRHCPCCPDIVMMRHYFSVRREIEVDACPSCGGFFLDHGELEAIRSQFATEEDRREAARAVFSETFDPQLEYASSVSNGRRERARAFARMIRVLLPSYWLPGKQPWGAY